MWLDPQIHEGPPEIRASRTVYPTPAGINTSPDGVLYCDKSRNGEWEGLVHLWFDKESFQYFGRSDQRPRPYAPFEEPQDEGKVDF
jgi:hypothetical protein